MLWFPTFSPRLAFALLWSTACATEGGNKSSGDDDGGSGDVVDCGPKLIHASPGCVDEGDYPAVEAGCYQECPEPAFSCGEGVCRGATVDPCVCEEGTECCSACAEMKWLCLPAEKLTDGFQGSLEHRDYCGDLEVYAWNDADSVVLGVGLFQDLLAKLAADPEEFEIQVKLPAERAYVQVLLGQGVGWDYCSDITLPEPEPVRYTASSGLVSAILRPAGAAEGVSGYVTIRLQNMELKRGGDEDRVLLGDYTIADIPLR